MLKWLNPDNLLLFSTFLMEGLWLYLWLALMGHSGFLGWQEVPLTPGSILLLLWLSYYSVQVLGQVQWSQRKEMAVAALFIVGLLALVTRLENGGGYALWDVRWLRFAGHNLTNALFTPMQATVAGGIYLWWRGYHLAKEGLGQGQVFHSFLVGLVGVVLGLVFWEVAFKSDNLQGVSRGQALVVVVAFFFSALTGLALSHLLRVRAEMQRREGAGAFFGQSWTLQLLGLVTAMVVVGLIAASVFSFSFLSPIFALFGFISAGLSWLVYYLFYPVALLATGVFYAVQWVIRRLVGEPTAQPLTLPDFSAFRQAVTPQEGGIPLWALLAKWMLLVAILGLTVFLLTRLVLRRRRTQQPEEALEETHQSVGGWQEFLRDLLWGLLLLRWWLRNKRDAALRRVPIGSRMSGWNVPEGELEVRQMYSYLLAGTRRAGFPRKDAETPTEYLSTLKGHMPEEGEALQELTDAYVSVRYGEQDACPGQKGVLNRLSRGVWERIRRT